jgi:hypothetical protein
MKEKNENPAALPRRAPVAASLTSFNLNFSMPHRAEQAPLSSERALTPLKAIRGRCLWCCLNSRMEVFLCPAKNCPLWPFRLGRGTKGQGLSPTKAIQRWCLICAGGADIRGETRGSTSTVVSCSGELRKDSHHDGSPCTLWSYRTAQARRQTKAKTKQARQSNQRPTVGQLLEELALPHPRQGGKAPAPKYVLAGV